MFTTSLSNFFPKANLDVWAFTQELEYSGKGIGRRVHGGESNRSDKRSETNTGK